METITKAIAPGLHRVLGETSPNAYTYIGEVRRWRDKWYSYAYQSPTRGMQVRKFAGTSDEMIPWCVATETSSRYMKDAVSLVAAIHEELVTSGTY